MLLKNVFLGGFFKVQKIGVLIIAKQFGLAKGTRVAPLDFIFRDHK